VGVAFRGLRALVPEYHADRRQIDTGIGQEAGCCVPQIVKRAMKPELGFLPSLLEHLVVGPLVQLEWQIGKGPSDLIQDL
jgi:hypothetical protein